jgi:hypothetical protein
MIQRTHLGRSGNVIRVPFRSTTRTVTKRRPHALVMKTARTRRGVRRWLGRRLRLGEKPNGSSGATSAAPMSLAMRFPRLPPENPCPATTISDKC